MGAPKCRNVGESQPVLIMIDPIISTRTSSGRAHGGALPVHTRQHTIWNVFWADFLGMAAPRVRVLRCGVEQVAPTGPWWVTTVARAHAVGVEHASLVARAPTPTTRE
jgi:hypothetical protein